ncbi:hypothetical protein, partial [Pedobacter sp. ASV28]|uniref:hypothetical protein n=1 Tax=Pedobacter sp. ASV28 TaxID=2795123 RepID=UPI0018EBA940
MPQIPPISDAYIDEIIKSAGPYVESINKTQGIKLRELIKVLRDYFEQEIPKKTSALTNDSNFVNASFLAGIPEEGNQKRPFIIRPLTDWDPDQVFGTGSQPVNMLLVATEYINEIHTVTQLKISDGVTPFKDLKNLVVNGLINGGSAGQTLEKKSTIDGDSSWVDIPQKIAEALNLKLNATDYNQHFRGKYTSLSALEAATFNPPLQAGDYAQVDPGVGTDAKNYNWDSDDNAWIEGGSGSAATNTDQLPEGTNNLYFTSSRAVNAVSNDYVHKSGNVNENISGKKNFQQAPILDSLTGNRILSLSSTKEMESFYEVSLPVITNTTVITQLTTAANWSATDVYTGSAITGAYQMQYYTDANYWYYFYNDTTPLRIPRKAAQLAATDAEAQAGTLTNKYLTPANWTYLKTIVNNISALWQFTVGIGIGIAGATSSLLKLAANTTTKSQVNLSPSATDVSAPVNGDVWNNAGELKFMDSTIVNRLDKVYNNELFKGSGNRLVEVNQYGDKSAVNTIKSRWIYNPLIISGITGATYGANKKADINVSGYTVEKGQVYFNASTGTLYEAYDDNKVMIVSESYDTVPTASSLKPVTSDGIKTALDGKVNNSTSVQTGNFNLTGTGRLDTGLGLGVAPNTTTWETILANTTTKSQLRLNPST